MGKRILIIDDEELIVQSLVSLLNSQGYTVKIAKSGKEALKIIQDNNFDLIICDVRMPEMDGIETITKIRSYLKKAKKKNIPEVIITGYADVDKYEKAMELKVIDYLYKPFHSEDLLKVIRKVIK
ncbi:MAG: response regulator [Candidatus Omnitrophica bacterium]|nr:response regulator [Candidatus Omnitrophota bacterium]MCM8827203.1 response regulator [Candidatus Omnitrophota bacterium]